MINKVNKYTYKDQLFFRTTKRTLFSTIAPIVLIERSLDFYYSYLFLSRMLFTAYFNCYQTLLGRTKTDRSRLWMLTKNTNRKQDSSAAILTAICNKRQDRL